MNTIIVGLDLSYSSAGVSLLLVDSEFKILRHEYAGFTDKIGVSTQDSRLTLYTKEAPLWHRFAWKAEHIVKTIRVFEEETGAKFTHFAVEDYAIHAKGRITEIAEFGGIVKYAVCRAFPNVNMRHYQIQDIKKLATGSGATKGKEPMVEAYFQLLVPLGYNPDVAKIVKCANKDLSPKSDIADASWISELLLLELRLRNGFTDLRDLKKHILEIVNRTTNAHKENILVEAYEYLPEGELDEYLFKTPKVSRRTK